MFGGGGGGKSTSQTKPWAGAYPYIIGRADKGNKPVPGVYGIYPLANEIFGKTLAEGLPQPYLDISQQMADTALSAARQNTPQMLAQSTGLFNQFAKQVGVDPRAVLAGGLRGRIATPQAALTAGTTMGDAIRSGVLSPVVAGRRLLDYPVTNADVVNLQAALGSASGLGLLSQLAGRPVSPEQATAMYQTLAAQQGIQQALSGTPNNPWLQQAAQSYINAAQRAFNDQVQRLQTALLPQARAQAIRAGQYGSNRQAIEEALLASQAATQGRRLLEAGQEQAARLFASAYENAARNQAALAGQLADISGRGAMTGSTVLGELARTGLQGFYGTLGDTLRTRAGLTGQLMDAANRQQLALADLQTKADLGQLGLARDVFLRAPTMIGQLYGLGAKDQLRQLGMLETAQNAVVAPLDLQSALMQNYVASISPFTGAGGISSFKQAGGGTASHISGALRGAAAGAALGSAIPGIGTAITAIGAVAGGLLGGLT